MTHKVLFLGVVLTVFLSCSRTPDLEFIVLFEDAKGVRVGEKVMWKGLPIGEVLDIKLHKQGGIGFKLHIHDAYRDTVKVTSAFMIKEPFINLSGEKHVEMRLLDPNGPRIAPGAVIQGYSSSWDIWLKEGSDKFKELTEELAVKATKLQHVLEEYAQSEEAAELKKQLQELAEQAAESGRKGLELTKEKLSQLTRDIEQIYQRLEREGKLHEAKKLREQLNEFLRASGDRNE